MKIIIDVSVKNHENSILVHAISGKKMPQTSKIAKELILCFSVIQLYVN